MKKKALIFGITGQDGSYLAELLIKKNYIVHGVKRRSSSLNTGRIDHLYQDRHEKKLNFILHYGDLTDAISVSTLIKKIMPDEIYNLAAQSHVAVYGVAKVYAHWITINYREAYNIFACNGILFNHESPVRGETFVTKKIVSALCKIKLGKQKKLFLGNLDAKRDWGHARDYVLAMWKMMQKNKPSDYVISTGEQYSVKDFVNMVLKELKMKYYWKGQGINSKCYIDKHIIIECDKEYFRPLEVDTLLGDSSKAKKELNWKPKVKIKNLIKEMVDVELKKFNYVE
jgi:GDP-D-mannose dehydratase